MNREKIITLLENNTIIDIVREYDLTEELILECLDILPIDILCEFYNFSEDFVIKALENESIIKEDIKNFNIQTHINFSQEFIDIYSKYINWSRMILYISTQSDDFNKYVSIIEENNLWDMISTNDLPIDFIRKHKDKLNWNKLTIVKKFNDEEIEEFKDYIVKFDINHEYTNQPEYILNNEIVIDDELYDKIVNLMKSIDISDILDEKTTL
ncbi:MAG: hypothetical protein M0R46_06705 [Candidatus Muirbacterium halophilum]|nr:hypothetical protein [Candidatus Muirbacterium halophilum]